MRNTGEKKTDDKQLNTLIPPTLDKKLKLYCVENGKKQKEIVELALTQFLANVKN